MTPLANRWARNGGGQGQKHRIERAEDQDSILFDVDSYLNTVVNCANSRDEHAVFKQII